MKFIKKHWFSILIVIMFSIRFLLSFNMPSFIIRNLRFDDMLMISQSNSLLFGNYLGAYDETTLIKGPMFSLLITFSRLINISYSVTFTILYLLVCAYFFVALRKIVDNKKVLIIIYAFILFNPVTYSSDLFQRLYRNTISITELLFFIGAVINVLKTSKNRVLNNITLGLIVSIMLLTREDTMWTIIVLLVVYGYKIITNIKNKNKSALGILISLIPIFIIIINLNIVSYINYKHYNIYTYNELNNTSFKEAYKRILQIKDDKKIDRVAIPKSTVYKLVDNITLLRLDREEIDSFYVHRQNENGEIDNGNIIWYLRGLIAKRNYFKDGKEADIFYKKLSLELDYLFENGTFEKEMVSPSVFIYLPTKHELFELPKSFIKTVIYTSTYKNIKTLSLDDIKSYEKYKYDDSINAYTLSYPDYRNSANIPKNNPPLIEIIRLLYSIFTIIFSFVAVLLFIKNIFKLDLLSVIIDIILICYLIIILGISYNNVTAFPSIRYSYLGNIYILQNLFILLNIYRYFKVRGKIK